MVEQRAGSGVDPDLDLRVDRDYDLPLGVQLGWKLRALIASGKIGAGERLPSVRELAKRAGVNVNTVRTVYGRLEGDGFIFSRHGQGTFAADPAPSSADVERLAAAAVADARAEGLDPRDLATAIYAAAQVDEAKTERSQSGGGGGPDDDLPPAAGGSLPDLERESDQPGARREFRRQLAHLEEKLSSYPESSLDAPTRLGPQPYITDVAVLERTRNAMVGKLVRRRTEAARRAEQQDEARAWIEEMAADPAGHRWERISNEQLGEPGCRHWHAVPRYSLLGMLLGWWRVKVSSGCPLAGAA